MNELKITCDASYSVNPAKTIMVADAARAVREGKMTCDAMMKGLADKGFTGNFSRLASVMKSDSDFAATITAFAKDAGFELGDANIDALGTFFMVWNEAEINRLFRGRTAAQSFKINTQGNWLTEKIIFKTREPTSTGSGFYDDFARPSYVGYKYSYDNRDTLRMEWGIAVTNREEAVASVMRRNAYKDKKDALVLKNSIWENNFFWNGATVSGKKLYGVLDEPGVAARGYFDLPASSSSKDLSDVEVDIETVIATFRLFKQNMTNDLQGNGDADTLSVKIYMPLSWQQCLTTTNTYMGYTANKWLAENWKNAVVEFKPELEGTGVARKGHCMVFAESVPGVGLDTFNLARTSTMHLVGAMPSLTGREEAYSSSVAGALCACPLGQRIYECRDHSSDAG